jgi:hypothetical protein
MKYMLIQPHLLLFSIGEEGSMYAVMISREEFMKLVCLNVKEKLSYKKIKREE